MYGEGGRVSHYGFEQAEFNNWTHQSMMLVERAAEKPSMLKLSSVAVHSARPAMMGNRERFTHNPSGGNEHTSDW